MFLSQTWNHIWLTKPHGAQHSFSPGPCSCKWHFCSLDFVRSQERKVWLLIFSMHVPCLGRGRFAVTTVLLLYILILSKTSYVDRYMLCLVAMLLWAFCENKSRYFLVWVCNGWICHNISFWFSPFTPKSDQLQFFLSVSHQRYIIQYGEFGNRYFAQMKVDWTIISHYISQSFFSWVAGRICIMSLGLKGLMFCMLALYQRKCTFQW